MLKAREQILEVHSRKKRLADDVDLKVIAKKHFWICRSRLGKCIK